MNILLAEDERRMAQALCEILRREGYDVNSVFDGTSAVNALETKQYDVIILDVMMPGMSGFEVASYAREMGIDTPILMLTAKAELDDKVEGLDSGADDYLTKPFMTKELLARIRALTRRRKKNSDTSLSYGDIALEKASFTLKCTSTEQTIRLSDKEFRILEYLISNSGQILTREQFAVRIWGSDSESEYNNVEVYMTFTRKKLSFVGSKTKIKAVRGLGYELRFIEGANV
ncbi:MAG: response regulator transcription factor [Clostridia bacterium]|nr:response regulator transcription factor [Clostridia bacterium]MBQ2348161.1 response regulator transcription factor [Clostridia bacterium]